MMQQSNSSADIFNTTDPETIYSLVQNVFSTTKCYDIMQNSSKVSVRLTMCQLCVRGWSSWNLFPHFTSHLERSFIQATVFETTIPFQLAFFALVEHGALTVSCVNVFMLLQCDNVD